MDRTSEGREIEAEDERLLECNDEIMIMILLHSTQYAIDSSGGVWRLLHPRCIPS